MSTIESPGSLIDFISRHVEGGSVDVTEQYFKQFDEYRQALADEAGISTEELHYAGRSTVIGAILSESGVE